MTLWVPYIQLYGSARQSVMAGGPLSKGAANGRPARALWGMGVSGRAGPGLTRAAGISFQGGRKCLRNRKPRRTIRFEFTGCTSTRSYRPKFCGSCIDGRCCTPHTTHTAEVQFRCPEGDTFVRKMMMIRSCACHHDCPADNDIFLATYHRRMIGDHVKLERQ